MCTGGGVLVEKDGDCIWKDGRERNCLSRWINKKGGRWHGRQEDGTGGGIPEIVRLLN